MSLARASIPTRQVAQKASPSVRRVTAVRPQPRVRVVVRATQGEEEPVFDTLKTSTGDEAAPDLVDGIKSVSDFTGLGFTGGDSAGQSNIFSVEPKMYVADEDDKSGGGSGALVGVIASVLALGAATLNGVALKDTPVEDEFSAYSGDSLTVVYAKVAGKEGPWVTQSAPSPQDFAVADAAADAAAAAI